MAVVLYFASERGSVPALIWLTLAIAVYLTVLELRGDPAPFRIKAWWVSLVLLTHFFGYLALRAYGAFRRARGSPAE